MTDSNSGDSPFEGAGAAGPHATETFALLGNETRLSILLALWEAHEPHGEDGGVSFSALQDRVGMRDSGQFNYHLDKLADRFIRKDDEGYTLRRPGRLLVQSIIAGTGIEEPVLERTPIDATCPSCGAATAVTYENAYVYQVCTECDGMAGLSDEHPRGAFQAWTFEPTGLADRSAEAVFAASMIKNYGRIALRFEEICPACSGPVEWTMDICEDHEPTDGERCAECGREKPIQVRETCTVCKSGGYGSPSIKVLFHPAVIAFCYEHGIEVGFTGNTDFEDVMRTLELLEEFEETVVSVDPVRLRIVLPLEGDQLALTLDDEMNVIDVSEEPSSVD